MQKKEKITVYPYSCTFAPIIRYLIHRENKNNIYKLVSPHGFRLTGQDAGDADLCGKIGITVSEDIEQALLNSDTLLIADGKFSDTLIHKIFSLTKTAMKQGKRIIFLLKISENEQQILKECANENKVIIEFYSSEQQIFLENSLDMLYKQQSTVIGIGKIFPEIDNTNLVLSLKKFLEKNGYKVNMLLDKHYAKLLGGHPMPNYIGGGTNIEDQIIKLNHYVEAIECNHRSDIILVQYPGGMQQFDYKVISDLGARFYIASQAITPDYFFCCFPFLQYLPDYINQLSTAFTYKYSMPIDVALLSNMGINKSYSHEQNQIKYFTVPENRVNELLAQINQPKQQIKWFSLNNEIELSQTFENMMDKLANYSTVIPV